MFARWQATINSLFVRIMAAGFFDIDVLASAQASIVAGACQWSGTAIETASTMGFVENTAKIFYPLGLARLLRRNEVDALFARHGYRPVLRKYKQSPHFGSCKNNPQCELCRDHLHPMIPTRTFSFGPFAARAVQRWRVLWAKPAVTTEVLFQEIAAIDRMLHAHRKEIFKRR